MVLLSMLILIGFGTYQSIVIPLSEKGLTQYRDCRIPDHLDKEYMRVVESVTWKFIIVSSLFLRMIVPIFAPIAYQ